MCSRAGTHAMVLFRADMHFAFLSLPRSRSAHRLYKKLNLIEIRAVRRRALMHLIVMPSLPGFFKISSFIVSPILCCAFFPLTQVQFPLK